MKTLTDLASSEVSCICGKRHRIATRIIRCGRNILPELCRLPEECGFRGCGLVVSDFNTHRAAGRKSARLLAESGHSFQELLLSGEEVHADSKHLHEVNEGIAAYHPSWLLAVGSGSICDLVKTAAHRNALPFAVVATAASMDGYLSANAAIFEQGIKKQHSNLSPAAGIIADTAILLNAPSGMTRAGLGDALGKFTSLLEWKLNHLLTGEFYCPAAAELIRREIQVLISSASGTADPFPDALIRTLLATGIAMQMMGNSTPASAGEHYFSHALDTFECAVHGRIRAAHGDQVALGTWKLLHLYAGLQKHPNLLPRDGIRYRRHTEEWTRLGVDLKDLLRTKSALLSALPDPAGILLSAEFRKETESLLRHLPVLRRIYAEHGLPVRAEMLGISPRTETFAWEHAVDMRTRFCLMDLIGTSETDVHPDRPQENNENHHRRKKTDDDRPERQQSQPVIA